MKTDQRILHEALTAYNESNFSSITTRHIAKRLNISPGNLHYHFKHTDDITIALYNQLANTYENLMNEIKTNPINEIGNLEMFIEKSMHIVYDFRFIFINIHTITSQIPYIKTHYRKIIKKRAIEFNNIFLQLIEKGIFRKDICGEAYKALTSQLFIIADSWILHDSIINDYEKEKSIKHYQKVISYLFYPYLQNTQQ